MMQRIISKIQKKKKSIGRMKKGMREWQHIYKEEDERIGFERD